MLEPVRRLCNTVNREVGADAWRSLDELADWLDREHWQVPEPGGSDLEALRDIREMVWRSIRDRRVDVLAPVAARAAWRAAVHDGRIHLVPDGGAADTVAAIVTGLVRDAQRDGTWTRLKTCEHCGWVFHDRSRNRSGRWCSMAACGGRAKARTYRTRRAHSPTNTT